MARFLFDALFEKDAVKNYTIGKLIEKEPRKMKAIFQYTISVFKLTSDSTLRSAISDKLSHLPGRAKRPKLVEETTEEAPMTEEAALKETN